MKKKLLSLIVPFIFSGTVAAFPISETEININVNNPQENFTLPIEKINEFTWMGLDNNGHVILTIVNNKVSGNVEYEGLRYKITQRGNKFILQRLDPSLYPEDHPKEIEVGNIVNSINETSADLTIIDVMVVYSNQTALASSAIDAEIQEAIDTTNLAYINSGVNIQLRLVHKQQVNYDESGNFSTDLNRLTYVDGYIDEVHNLREQYGADLVSLFIEGASYCGIGWIGPEKIYGFSVVNRDCAVGNSSFPHELGHNMGLRHDPYVDSGITPYSYGHGYVNTNEQWRTIMAYSNACAAAGTSCPRVLYFSNPLLHYPPTGSLMGTPEVTGTPTSDAAKALNISASIVAGFVTAGGSTTTTTPTIAVATISPTSFNFPATQVNRTSSSQTSVLSNTGNANLTISSFTQNGSTDFKKYGTCAVNSVLTPGQTCTIIYYFVPSSKGAKSATLTINTNGGNPVLTLSGTGKTGGRK